jgi:hypothetical protein
VAAVVGRLRGELEVYEDERGRQLFDAPEGSLPDADGPVPVRFLGAFDNLLVAHADRSRVIEDRLRDVVVSNLGRPPVLIDGYVRGWWRVDAGTMHVELFDEPDPAVRDEIEAEGAGLLEFTDPDRRRQDVQISVAANLQ